MEKQSGERVYTGFWVLGLSGFKKFQFRGTGAADKALGVYRRVPGMGFDSASKRLSAFSGFQIMMQVSWGYRSIFGGWSQKQALNPI